MAFLDFLPTLGGLANSALNGVFGMIQSKSLMRYQAQLQQKMIDQANLYNSPENQVKRLTAAGLNPNLVYGSGVTGNQSETGKVSAVNRDSGIDLRLGDIMQSKLQRKAVEQQVNLSRAQQMESMSRVANNMMRYRLGRATFADDVRQIHANVQHTLQSMRESAARTDEAIAKTNNLVIDANRLAELGKQEGIRTDLMKQYSAKEMRAKIREVNARANYYGKQRELADSVMKLNDAKIEQLKADADWLVSRKHSQDLDNQLTERMNGLGLQGFTPKDFFQLLKDIVLSFMRGG